MFAHDHKIGYMGRRASQSHLAAQACFPSCSHHSYESFAKVVEAVAEGKVHFGMLALESLTAGRVQEVHDLLRGLSALSISIFAEYFSPVVHQLAARPGSRLGDIVCVISHPQALQQCSNAICENGWRQEPFSDTASAAKHVSEQSDPGLAAICSAAAAELYGLTVLEPAVQDDVVNVTVFLVIGKRDAEHRLHQSPTPPCMQTTLVVTVANQTGALHRVFECFAEHDVNIVRFESYIKAGPTNEGEVLVTVEGTPEKGKCQRAIAQLNTISRRLDHLGVYPSADERCLSADRFRQSIREANTSE